MLKLYQKMNKRLITIAIISLVLVISLSFIFLKDPKSTNSKQSSLFVNETQLTKEKEEIANAVLNTQDLMMSENIGKIRAYLLLINQSDKQYTDNEIGLITNKFKENPLTSDDLFSKNATWIMGDNKTTIIFNNGEFSRNYTSYNINNKWI
jgi:hypothetical protein